MGGRADRAKPRIYAKAKRNEAESLTKGTASRFVWLKWVCIKPLSYAIKLFMKWQAPHHEGII